GLGDQKLASLLAQTLQSADVPSRHVEGRRMSQSPPAVLLQEVAVLLNHMTVRELATLVRCPSVHAWLSVKLQDQLESMDKAGRLPLLGWLDTFIHDRLGQRFSMNADEPASADDQSDTASAVVHAMWDAIRSLLPEHHDT